MENYKIEIFWSNKDNAFIGVCPAFDGLAVVADTREDALKEAQTAITTYLTIYKEDGIPIPAIDTIPEYSGQVRLRLPRSLHQRAAAAAVTEGVSLNTFLLGSIAEKLGAIAYHDRQMIRLESRMQQQTVANLAALLLPVLSQSQKYETANTDRSWIGQGGSMFTINLTQ